MIKLKNYTKLLLITITGLLFSTGISTNVDAATVMPEAVDGVITLTEDVTLSSPYVIASGKTLTIDINGHTLTGPTNNYTIDNQGDLIIIDNGATKGKIHSNAPNTQKACIRNNKTMKINGVTINSEKDNAVVNEPNATIIIDDSTLTTAYQYKTCGAFKNYGNATINNSTMKSTYKAAAGLYLDSKDGSVSTTVVNNSLISGTYSSSSSVFSHTNAVGTFIMNNGEIAGKIALNDNIDKKLSGTIKTDYLDKDTILPIVEKGSTLVLTKGVASSSNRVIPEGVTLKIPKGVTYQVWSSKGNGSLKGDIVVEGTLKSRAYNETQKTYYAKLGQALTKATENDKIILTSNTSETVSNTKNVELDLNSKTLTGNITNEENAILKIYDASEKAKGKVNGTITNNSKLILENGYYTSLPVTGAKGTTEYNEARFLVNAEDTINLPNNMGLVKTEDSSYIVEALADTSKLEEILKKTWKTNRRWL